MLLTLLINERAALMERGVRIHAQLSQLAAEGEGLAGLARAIASLAGRGVAIQDKRLRGLADQPSLGLQQVWEEVLKRLGTVDNLPEPLRDRKQAGQQTGVITQDLSGGLT